MYNLNLFARLHETSCTIGIVNKQSGCGWIHALSPSTNATAVCERVDWPSEKARSTRCLLCSSIGASDAVLCACVWVLCIGGSSKIVIVFYNWMCVSVVTDIVCSRCSSYIPWKWYHLPSSISSVAFTAYVYTGWASTYAMPSQTKHLPSGITAKDP